MLLDVSVFYSSVEQPRKIKSPFPWLHATSYTHCCVRNKTKLNMVDSRLNHG